MMNKSNTSDTSKPNQCVEISIDDGQQEDVGNSRQQQQQQLSALSSSSSSSLCVSSLSLTSTTSSSSSSSAAAFSLSSSTATATETIESIGNDEDYQHQQLPDDETPPNGTQIQLYNYKVVPSEGLILVSSSSSSAASLSTTSMPAVKNDGLHIIVVDGPSCIGKTTMCDISFDFSDYVAEFGEFKNKTAQPDLRVYYDAMVFLDFYEFVLRLRTNWLNGDYTQKRIFIDRSFLSGPIYEMLFSCGGGCDGSQQFIDRFRARFLSDNYRKLTTTVLDRILFKLRKLFTDSNMRMDFVWCVPEHVEAIASAAETRQSSCEDIIIKQSDFERIEYIKSQAHVFGCMADFTGVGVTIPFDEGFISHELILRHLEACYGQQLNSGLY